MLRLLKIIFLYQVNRDKENPLLSQGFPFDHLSKSIYSNKIKNISITFYELEKYLKDNNDKTYLKK